MVKKGGKAVLAKNDVKFLRSQIEELAELADQYRRWYTDLQSDEFPISDWEAFNASARKEKEEIESVLHSALALLE